MRFLCKDCWIAHEPRTLLASCKECDARTQIVRLDPLQTKASSISADDRDLVCRIHRQEPLDVFCGVCRRAVPPRAVIGAQSVVALVGDTASGKTSLLWALAERLRKPAAAGVLIRAAIGDSDAQLSQAMREIVSKGARPTPPTDAEVRNYAWELMTTGGAREGWVIAFHDAAGEMWRGLGGLQRAHYERFYRYLGLVGSVVLAIDGAQVAAGLDARDRGESVDGALAEAEAHELTIVDELARRIRPRGEPVPVAVTITKSDMLWDRGAEWELFRPGSNATAQEIDRAVRNLLERSGRHALLSAVESSFAPLQFFAVSAFGRTPPSPFRLADLQPSRVEEPLLAMLGADRVLA